MKLIIVLAVIANCNGDKLDRRYLPPSSANTAGGSPGSLQAPFETQKDQAGGSFGPSQTPFENQRSTQAPNQRQYPSYEQGQSKPQAQPAFTGQDGTSAQQSQVDIQEPRLPGSYSHQDTFSQPGLQKVSGQQFDRPSQNNYERQSVYKKPVGSALQDYPSSSQMSLRPDYTRPQQSTVEQPGFRQNENAVPQNLPVGQQVNQPSFIPNEEDIGSSSGNSEIYPGFKSSDLRKPSFSRNEQPSSEQPSFNQNNDNAPTQGFSGPDDQNSSGPFRGQNVDYSRNDVRPERLQAAQDRTAEILRYENENDGETFAYNFETSNGITAEEHGIATNGVQAEGAFSYIGDNGQSYSVTYTADENGYQPQGAHLPTPHPIPDVILKSIERNALAAANARQEGNQFNGNDVPARSEQYNAEPQEYSDGIESQQPYNTQSGPQTYNDGFSKPQFDPNRKPQTYNPQSGPQSYNADLSQTNSVPTPSQQQYNPQSGSQNYNTGSSDSQSSTTPIRQDYSTQSGPQTNNDGFSKPQFDRNQKPQPYKPQSRPQAYSTGLSQTNSVPTPSQQQYNPQSASQTYNTGSSNLQSSSIPIQQNYNTQSGPQTNNDGVSKPQFDRNQKPQPYNPQSGPQDYSTGLSQTKSVPTPGQQQYNPQPDTQTYNTGFSDSQSSSTPKQQEYNAQYGPQPYNDGFRKPQSGLNQKPQPYNSPSGPQVYNTDFNQPKSVPTPSQQQYNPQSGPQPFNQFNVPVSQQQFNTQSTSQSYPSGPQNASPSFAKPINEVTSNLPSIGNDCSNAESCRQTGSQFNANSQPNKYSEPAQYPQPESTPSSGFPTVPELRRTQPVSSGIQQIQGSQQPTVPFKSSPKLTNQQQQYTVTPQENSPSLGSQQIPNAGSIANSLGQNQSPIKSSNMRTGSGPQQTKGGNLSGPYNYPVPSPQFGQKTALGTNNNISPLQGRVPNQERVLNAEYNQLRPDGFQTSIQEPRPDQPSTSSVAPSSSQQNLEQRQKPQGFTQAQNNIDNFGTKAQPPYRVNGVEESLQQFPNVIDKQRQDSRFPPYGPVLVPSSDLKPNLENGRIIQAPQDSFSPSSKQSQAQAPSRGNLAQAPSNQYSDTNEQRGDTRFPPYGPGTSPSAKIKPEIETNQNTYSPKYNGPTQQQSVSPTQFSNAPTQEQQNIDTPQFSSPKQDISRPTEQNRGLVRKPFGSQSGMRTLQTKPSDVAYITQGSQNQPSRSQQYTSSSQPSGAPDSNQKQDADEYPGAPYSSNAPQSGPASVGGKPGQFPSRGQIRFNNSGPKSEEQFPSSRQPPSFSAQEGYKY